MYITVTIHHWKYLHLKFAWVAIFKNFFFSDVSNQANLLLVNLKEVIGKLQAERNYFKTQVEKLQIEKQQLTLSNQNMKKKLNSLEKKQLKTITTL